MKKIAFVLLFIPMLCFAQNKKALNHFWDIPWGTTIDRAEKIFADRGFTSHREEGSLVTTAKYEGEAATIMLLFNKADRFYCGNVIYSFPETALISKYDNYRKVLFRRYGMPDTAIEFYEPPYKKGDGREIEAISTENAFYFTDWHFNDNNIASISILKNLDLCLTFKSPVYGDTNRL
jgi:hypothetical protein